MLYALSKKYLFRKIIILYLYTAVTFFVIASGQNPPEIQRFQQLDACKALSSTSLILPSELKNIYLGIDEENFKTRRPDAKAVADYRILGNQDPNFLLIPAIFKEEILESVWENAYFTIFKERLSEIKLVTFKASSEDKDLALRTLIETHGLPGQKCIKSDGNGIFLIWNTTDSTIEVSASKTIDNKTSFVFRVVAKGHEQLLSTTKEYLDVGQETEKLESLEQNLLPQLKDLEHIQPN